MNSGSDVDELKFDMSKTEVDKFSPSGFGNSTDDMVKSESKIPLRTPVKDGEPDVQVKFSINESSINGRGKCPAENALPSFSGLSKEELLKYANDPFWIRMRLFLFIFFWIVWIAMFVGAIAIIIMAPKCEPPKKPEWYEQGPLYEVDLLKFFNPEVSDSPIQQLKSTLNYLSDLQIKGIILSPIFKNDNENEENVIDFKSIDNKIGTLQDFKDFITETKSKGINVILSLVPNHSSNKHIWFNKSITRESPYDNYYIWSSGSGESSDGTKVPPNNWLSLTGEPAWEWVEERQEFYLHQFNVDQPDLNFHNPHVLQEMNDVFSFWIDLGVQGFNLDKVQYLLEDLDLQDELPGEEPGAVHTQYKFYSHKKTHNIPGVADILSKWRQNIRQMTDNNGVLVVTGDVPPPADSNKTTTIVDIIRSDKLLKDLRKNFSAKDLYPRLRRIIDSTERWPSVQLGDRYMKRVSDLFGKESVDGLNMITLLLRATPITYFGEELGLSDQIQYRWEEVNGLKNKDLEKESHYKVYKSLIEARDTQTVLYGNSSLKLLNDSVLIFTRINLGSPGYLVVYNPSLQNITVDLSNLDYIPNDLMIYTRSLNFILENITTKDKVKSKNIFLKAKSAAVFTFAPKTVE